MNCAATPTPKKASVLPKSLSAALALGALGAALPACDQGKDDKKASATATVATTTTAAPAASTGAVPASTGAMPKLAAGRSAIPTLEEWAAMKEVTVKGSSALNCETKMVREYLRVSCRGKNDTGGTPTVVKVVSGGPEIRTFAAAGVTSAVVPYLEGTYASIQFSWTNKSHYLVLQWPKGSKMPPVLGVFEGAKSPLDSAETVAADTRLCDCHKKVKKEASCETALLDTHLDCDHTYGSDCEKLLKCSQGDVSAPPKCRPGYHHLSLFECMKSCTGPGDKSCPAGTTCKGYGEHGNVGCY